MKLASKQYEGWKLRGETTFGGHPLFSFETVIKDVLVRQVKRRRFYPSPRPRILKPITFGLDIAWLPSKKIFKLHQYSMKAHPDYVQFHCHIYVSKTPADTWICWGSKGETWRITESKVLKEVLESHLMTVIGILADYSRGDYHAIQALMEVWTIPIGREPKKMDDDLIRRFEKMLPLPSSFWRGEE